MPPRKLNERQEEALERVKAASTNFNQVRDAAYAEARKQAEARIAVEQQTLDIAVRAAVDVGVPKSRVHIEGMGNKNPWSIYESLERTDPHKRSTAPNSPFTWESRKEGLIAISYPAFPTTSHDDEYPAVLSGVVRVDATGNNFTVVRDDTERETEYGTIPGLLDWEMQRPAGTVNRLPDLLREWLEVNW